MKLVGLIIWKLITKSDSLRLHHIAGLMATYHAKNEYCLLFDMCQGYQVFVSVISQLEDSEKWYVVLMNSP